MAARKKAIKGAGKTRKGIRNDALVMLVATLGVAIMVNVVMINSPLRIDLTKYKVHTLSAESVKAASSLENVTVHVYISKNLPENIPTQFGAKQSLKGVDRAFRDKLEEYATAAGDNLRLVYVEQDYPSSGSVTDQAEAAKLDLFSSTEAKVEGEQVRFARYALGATFHYKNVQEVLPKALEPGYFEFEITKRLLRLKEKYDNSLLMKDLLVSGKKVYQAVKACDDKLQEVAKDSAAAGGAGPLDLTKTGSGNPAKDTLKRVQDGRSGFESTCRNVGPVLGAAKDSLNGRNEFVDNLLKSAQQHWNIYNEMLRYLDGKGRKDVPPEAAVSQLVQLSANIAGEVDRRHTTLTDSPGQRRIGFLCGHGEFCPFREQKPLFDPQMAAMVSKNQMMKQIADTGHQMAQGIDKTNQGIGDGLFTKQGFAITKVRSGRPIPESVAALVVYAPQGKLDDYDRYQVDQFLLSGRPVAMFVQNYEVAISNLYSPKELGQDIQVRTWIKPTSNNLPELLASYGVVVNRDLILDAKHVDTVKVMELVNRNGMKFQAQRDFPYALIPVMSSFDRTHALTRSIQSASIPYTSSIVVDPKVKNNAQFEVHELIQASEEAFTKSKFQQSPSDSGFPVIPLQVNEAAKTEVGTGPMTVAVTLRGPFTSAFEGKDIPRRPKAQGRPDPFAPPGQKNEETDADRELAKRRRKNGGVGKLLVVASNLGIEGLNREQVLTDFNALALTKFSVEGMKMSSKWQANFQNWQIRVGQVSHLLQDNLRLIANVMDWAVAHEALADIRSKGDTRRPLAEVSTTKAATLRWSAIAGAPLLLILFGFLRIHRRQRRVAGWVESLERKQASKDA
ncbi:MAG TPA: hypothetical protein DCQ06_09605 [Myxococcales bacterium]|nr:hypothetical protein [Myxococcales bacterium]